MDIVEKIMKIAKPPRPEDLEEARYRKEHREELREEAKKKLDERRKKREQQVRIGPGDPRYCLLCSKQLVAEGRDKAVKDILNMKIYLKIPITTRYSGDLIFFDKSKTRIVEGTEFCEKDIFGDSVCCWYVSTVFGAVEDFEWLIHEIIECGCIQTIQEKRNGLFV